MLPAPTSVTGPGEAVTSAEGCRGTVGELGPSSKRQVENTSTTAPATTARNRVSRDILPELRLETWTSVVCKTRGRSRAEGPPRITKPIVGGCETCSQCGLVAVSLVAYKVAARAAAVPRGWLTLGAEAAG